MSHVLRSDAPRRRVALRPLRARVRAGGRPQSASAVLAVAVCGILAGCGQAEQVRDALTYTGDVNRVQAGFERDLVDLRRAADRAEVPADVQRAVLRLSRSVDAVQVDLRRIDPPSTVTTLHRRLIVAFGRWSAPLEAFRAALGSRRTTASLRRARDAFVRDTASVERGVGAAAVRINERLRSLSD